jgi:hypothetical protein
MRVTERTRGVFDDLPKRRPALRSSRRDRQATARRAWTAENEPDPSAGDDEDGIVSDGPGEPSGPGHGGVHDRRDGARDRLEDLVLAGVGAAADIVVLGVKLAGRAMPGGHRAGSHTRDEK